MGTVIRFPVERRTAGNSSESPRDGERGKIIILPVVRIERWDASEPPARSNGARAAGRGRKRVAQRGVTNRTVRSRKA
jgi:hypothetical protein